MRPHPMQASRDGARLDAQRADRVHFFLTCARDLARKDILPDEALLAAIDSAMKASTVSVKEAWDTLAKMGLEPLPLDIHDARVNL